jgi:hypothetical protein
LANQSIDGARYSVQMPKPLQNTVVFAVFIAKVPYFWLGLMCKMLVNQDPLGFKKPFIFLHRSVMIFANIVFFFTVKGALIGFRFYPYQNAPHTYSFIPLVS